MDGEGMANGASMPAPSPWSKRDVPVHVADHINDDHDHDYVNESYVQPMSGVSRGGWLR
jgi:hypothetical protein